VSLTLGFKAETSAPAEFNDQRKRVTAAATFQEGPIRAHSRQF
jgi:hypothetical protein